MDCRRCNMEMMVTGFEYTATGDDSKETPTQMYHTAICACRNPECSMLGVKFLAAATELPRPRAQRRFCAGCGLLLAEISGGTAVLPEAVRKKAVFLGEDVQIDCPECGKREEIKGVGEKEA